jgi:hypothetical protein
MNADRTVATAWVVFPKIWVSIRAQTTSYKRPVAPERKNRT